MEYKQKKKKILLIAEYDQFGGAKTYFIDLLKFYRQKNFEVTVCISESEQDVKILQLINELKFHIIKIEKRWKGLFNCWDKPFISLFIDLMLIYKAFIKVRPDLITVSNINAKSFLGLAFFSTPFLCIMHSYPLKNQSKIFIIQYLRYFQKILLKRIFSNAAKRILSVSSYSKSEIVKFLGIPEERISVIYNFGREASEIKQDTISNDKFTVLTLGHVREYKNPFVWIKVAEKVIQYLPEKNIEFIWGGDGELMQECNRLVTELKIGGKVKFIGYTEDIACLYASASVYFQPSMIESQGIAVVEAMAYSLPCVVSDMGGLPESVENGINGYLVSPDNIDEMSQAIIALVNDERLRNEKGEHSLRIYNEKFTNEIWKQKMNELHEKIFLSKTSN
ncbi:MAG: glycosyltransferase family 4 protein [Bacteroidales bacterium]